MRISTAMFHEHTITSILNAQSKTEETQNKLATGQKMLYPSEDPAAATRALELRQAIATTDQYQKNANTATARLNLEESSLVSVNNVLQRVRELAVQANNAHLTSSDRNSIAVEVRQNLNELMDLANTQDANHEYLFAGHNTKTQPFKLDADKVTYVGDQGTRYLQIASSDKVASGDSGWEIFMNVPSGEGNGVFVTAPNTGNNGTGSIDSGTIINLSEWQQDSYSLEFTSDDAYEIKDSAGNSVTVGSYRSGDAIAFRGIQTSITGRPISGDKFTIASVGPNPNNTGNAIMDHSAIVDSSLWKSDVYTLSFPNDVDNYEITDSEGKVVNHGNYESGKLITFNGIQTKLMGAPQLNDSFIISPGAKQDIFSTISNLADTLENATGEKASVMVDQTVSRTLKDIDHAHNRVLDTRAAVGSRLNRINSAQDTNNYFSIQLNSSLSKIEDLDYTTAVSDLNLQTLGLQAAQQAYIKVSGLSLFSRLG